MLPSIFARIVKVDEETRTVTGRATQELVDRDNEMFDYASSKPEFQRWSAEVYADSGGKSLGNVRSMHGATSAGKLTDIQYDDAERAIDVAAKIVDDNEWKKVQEGCYTGFSIGGRYAKKWPDVVNGKMVNRYTAVPSELSIVDRPCVPTAKFFNVHKKDGTVVETPFAFTKVAIVPTRVPLLLKDAKPTSDYARGKDPNADDAIATDPNGNFGGKEDGGDAEKRDFSDKERQHLADIGAALPDGSFPIKTAADVDNAVQAHGRAKDKAKAKAHIKARAKALGATHKLPESWKLDIATFSVDALAKFLDQHSDGLNTALKASEEFEFTKGIYDVSALASVIAQLKQLADAAAYERKIEGDSSGVPEKLKAAASTLLACLSDMAGEEGTELANGTTAEDVMDDARSTAGTPLYRVDSASVEPSALAKELAKAFGIADLEKRGARNSAKDLEIIQKVHDASCELGAGCQSNPHDQDGKATGALPASQKMDDGTKETAKMAEVNKGDTVTAEGNKRGAAVTDPSMPPESGNGKNDDVTAGAGGDNSDDEARKAKARKAKPAGAPMGGQDDDDDDDAGKRTKARKAKARKAADEAYAKAMAKDDDDDDDDDDMDESRKGRKSAKFDMGELAKMVATATAEAVAKAMSGGEGVTIPRVGPTARAPNLMSVGKDGEVTKVSDPDALKKSVSMHPHDAQGLFKQDKHEDGRLQDNDTCTLIKGIHRNHIMVPIGDLVAIGAAPRQE